ncbi:MAG: hypothetical protein J6O04_11625 [Selenomonadaceae bacterium]|nr:hypothetical protein [Selenomonadaceae bacterium]
MLKKVIFVLAGVCFVFGANAFAMTFTQSVKIGTMGFPMQAPYHGFIITGEAQNTGKPYKEQTNNVKTYKKGVACYGNGDGALYCDYDFEAKDFSQSVKFGGKDNYVVHLGGSFKDIFKIENTDNLPMYAIYHKYCVTELNILGKQKSGKWVSFINSKEISKRFFGGKDAYKEDGGVMYDAPVCVGESIVIKYFRWHWNGESQPEGEFRLKWDDKADWFGIEQVVY